MEAVGKNNNCLGLSSCHDCYFLFIEDNILSNILKVYLLLCFCWYFASHLMLGAVYWIVLWFILANGILAPLSSGENITCKSDVLLLECLLFTCWPNITACTVMARTNLVLTALQCQFNLQNKLASCQMLLETM